MGHLLVIGAHAADFVWRASGTVAKHTAAGGNTATVVALSYGERGEAGDLWTKPGQTVDEVKRIRHDEAQAAAKAVGADFHPFDLGDYPLRMDTDAVDRLVRLMVQTEPSIVVTHSRLDPFNPDHPVAFAATEQAVKLAMGAAGVPSAFPTIPPPALYCFEPHLPEQCEYRPNVYVDITEVVEAKRAAMACMASQSYLAAHYEERGRQRAVQARYFGAPRSAQYAETFQRLTPTFTGTLA